MFPASLRRACTHSCMRVLEGAYLQKRIEQGSMTRCCQSPASCCTLLSAFTFDLKFAPSQGHGMAVDWWALGVLLYEMMAGFPPFYDEEVTNTYKKILNGRFNFSSHFSVTARDLIRRLLQVQDECALHRHRHGVYGEQLPYKILLHCTQACEYHSKQKRRRE